MRGACAYWPACPGGRSTSPIFVDISTEISGHHSSDGKDAQSGIVTSAVAFTVIVISVMVAVRRSKAFAADKEGDGDLDWDETLE